MQDDQESPSNTTSKFIHNLCLREYLLPTSVWMTEIKKLVINHASFPEGKVEITAFHLLPSCHTSLICFYMCIILFLFVKSSCRGNFKLKLARKIILLQNNIEDTNKKRKTFMVRWFFQCTPPLCFHSITAKYTVAVCTCNYHIFSVSTPTTWIGLLLASLVLSNYCGEDWSAP